MAAMAFFNFASDFFLRRECGSVNEIDIFFKKN